MRSYGQFCAIAKSLDIVGDRWTLLIVRELLIGGPSRYSDLRAGLPGIATNLLAERLRDLEAAAVITTTLGTPGPARYELTERGRGLESVLRALGGWGAPLLATTAHADEFQAHWLAIPLSVHLVDRNPDRPGVSIQIESDRDPLLLEVRGEIRARRGRAADADATISGSPYAILDLLFGEITLAQARARGVRYGGDTAILRRLRRKTAT